MKLYTEEQVRKAMADSYIIGTDREDNCLEIEEYIRKNLTPIELPSDEEIEERFDTNSNRLESQMYESGFRDGAKWMKEQILGKEDKTFKQKSKWTKL